MKTPGERFSERIFVEAPDFCSQNCQNLGQRLLLLTGEIDSGELDPQDALEPLVSLVNSCPKAVEAGGKSPIGAKLALKELNSMGFDRERANIALCAFDTLASWHAEMYAEGKDPYDGYLDFLDDDE